MLGVVTPDASATTRRPGMSLRNLLLGFASAACLCLGASLALADDAPPAPHTDSKWCKDNPGKCEEARKKHEAWCKDNPEQCEHWKQKAAERREWCEKNPEKCEEKKARMRERMAEIEEKCAKDPEHCDEIKAKAKERWKKHHQGGQGKGMGASSGGGDD
jgi:flagellar motility protein MotE (MotC chaperone)